MTKSRRWFDATPPLGTCACTGSMCGFAGIDMGFLDGALAVLRALDWGRGRVGRSVGTMLVLLDERTVTGVVGEEDLDELEEFS